MTGIEAEIMQWVNGFARRWPSFDHFVNALALNDAVKGMVTATLLVAVWFKTPAGGLRDQGARAPGAGTGTPESAEAAAASARLLPGTRPKPDAVQQRRGILLCGMLATMVALAVNRALASSLAHRPRPAHDVALGFVPPLGLRPRLFNDLSSFPSDHAVMFVGLAATLLIASRGIGLVALLHGIVVALLPRIYLGLHWPSDLLAGALLGLAFVLPMARPSVRAAIATPILAFGARRPALFHAGLFLLLFGFATLFDPIVKLAEAVRRLFAA